MFCLGFCAPRSKPVSAHLNPSAAEGDALVDRCKTNAFTAGKGNEKKPGRISTERTLDIWENVKETRGAEGGMENVNIL